MGSLIAVAARRETNVFDEATIMLEVLSHRGNDAFGVADFNEVLIKRNIKELKKARFYSQSLIGHNFAKIVSQDEPQPVQGRDFTFASDGRLFPYSSNFEWKILVEQQADIEAKARHLIQNFNGDYAFAVAMNGEIAVGRDSVGMRPLYYGENDKVYAVASEKKALREIEITNVKSFPPGNYAIISKRGLCLKATKCISQPPLEKIDIEAAAQRLRKALFQSTKNRVSDLEEVPVAFSGGVDSSIIAWLAKQCGVAVNLVSVSLKGQSEASFVENAAKMLDLPIHQATYTIDDMEDVLPKVLWSIETISPVSVSIALPFFWVAEQSSNLGYHVLVAGQGGDELFGGYHRYLNIYANQGLSGLQKKFYEDVVFSYEKNFQRDNKVCVFNGVELRLPFADWDVIQLALSLPPNTKILSPKDMLRKRVLRYTAELLGLPEIITEKPKKAIQYTTGVNQALKKLALKRGLTLQEYIKRIFSEIFGCRNQ